LRDASIWTRTCHRGLLQTLLPGGEEWVDQQVDLQQPKHSH